MAKEQSKGARTMVIISGLFFVFSAVISLLTGHLDKVVLWVVIATVAFVYAANMKVKRDDIGSEQ